MGGPAPAVWRSPRANSYRRARALSILYATRRCVTHPVRGADVAGYCMAAVCAVAATAALCRERRRHAGCLDAFNMRITGMPCARDVGRGQIDDGDRKSACVTVWYTYSPLYTPTPRTSTTCT